MMQSEKKSEKSASPDVAKQMSDAMEALWQTIQYALGQQQGLLVGMGAFLKTLPSDAPLRDQIMQDLKGWHYLLAASRPCIGMIDGFVSTQSSINAYLTGHVDSQAHTATRQ